MPYRIIEEDSKEETEAQVNKMLKRGWKCIGGLAVTVRQSSWEIRTYSQAMQTGVWSPDLDDEDEDNEEDDT